MQVEKANDRPGQDIQLWHRKETALAAHVPDDGNLDNPDSPQLLADDQNQQATPAQLFASRSSTEAESNNTTEAALAPNPGVPTPGVPRSTHESRDPGSHQQGAAASPRPEGGAASGSSAVGGLGLARMVTVSGRGSLTFGQLAMEQFRTQATQLRQQWEAEDRYVRQSVGRTIVSQSCRPTQARVRQWEVRSRERFHIRSSTRLRAAARLESMADEIAAKLLAAGVETSRVRGDAAPTPGASDQGSRFGGGTTAPSTAGASAAPEITIQSYVHVGISALRKEARELEELLANKALYVEQRVAERMTYNLDPNPPDKLLSQWRIDARRAHARQAPRRREKAAALRAQADEWEERLAAGALMQEDPDKATSCREIAPQPASKSDSTPVLPGAFPAAFSRQDDNATSTTSAH
ncbi:UNVERIFIED_CONTAM: KRUF family protein [Hammondia hammondi]|eukprot:XP_008888329.1 KRUF family protein [Hammondia hammondi]